MEFLQPILAFIALLIIWLRPKAENWAFTAMWLGWLLMIYLYVGHTSGALLGNMNAHSRINAPGNPKLMHQ